MAVKTEDEGNYGVPGDKLLENIIEGTQKERYIEMVRLKIGSPNEVITTEVLVVSENVASWVWLNPLLGYRKRRDIYNRSSKLEFCLEMGRIY